MGSSDTDEAAHWRSAGYAHYAAQRWSQALHALEQAVAHAPQDALAWYRLGNVHEELGRDADAARCFERAVAVDPAEARAWNNLGAALQRLGRTDAAEVAYREALRRDPALLEPCLNLGRLAQSRGALETAAQHFRAGLAQHRGHPMLEHLLAAVSGRDTPLAPAGYVRALFDAQAPQFERHLVDALEYRVPQELAGLVRPRLSRLGRTAQLLDLGCGTGLVGAALADTGARLVGVDLSPRMLAQARRHAGYVELVEAELGAMLERCAPGRFDAVLAADVFIYVGELDALFVRVAQVLRPGGAFAFSVESLDSGRFRLQPSGRYAQSLDYLRALAQAAGLAWCEDRATRIRREGQDYAQGRLVLLERPGQLRRA